MGKATELRDRVNMEVKESDSKIMPRLQYERKDDLAYQHITFQESGQRSSGTIGRPSRRSDWSHTE